MKVHLYAQYEHHGDAFIVADAEGLSAIRDACDAALRRGATAFHSFAEDGEGYLTFLVNLETRDPKWEQLTLPYFESMHVERTHDWAKIGPVDVIGTTKYREIAARSLADSA